MTAMMFDALESGENVIGAVVWKSAENVNVCTTMGEEWNIPEKYEATPKKGTGADRSGRNTVPPVDESAPMADRNAAGFTKPVTTSVPLAETVVAPGVSTPLR
jgi:hypothetical protein